MRRILEARFYTQKDHHDAPVGIGYILCNDGKVEVWSVLVEPHSPLDAETMRAKLRFLIEITHPDTCDRLLALRSEFWSFVELGCPDPPAREQHPTAGKS